MLKRVALLGFLAVLTAANVPGPAKAWDGCYYRSCYSRYNYYPRNYARCYRPNYYRRYYTGCRWCGGYARYGGGYDSYDGYYGRYNSYRYDSYRYDSYRDDDWYGYDW
jgi:hypothetical protein